MITKGGPLSVLRAFQMVKISTSFFAHIKKSCYRFIYHSSLVGIGSLIWFLIRTGIKPSRAVYPCQQASLASASLYLFPAILPLAHKLVRIRKKMKARVVLLVVCLVTLLCSGFLLTKTIAGKTSTPYASPASKAMSVFVIRRLVVDVMQRRRARHTLNILLMATTQK